MPPPKKHPRKRPAPAAPPPLKLTLTPLQITTQKVSGYDSLKQIHPGRVKWLKARRDSAEDFSRLNAPALHSHGRIFIPAYCFAIP